MLAPRFLAFVVAWCLPLAAAAQQPFPPFAELPEQAELPAPLTMLDGTPVSTPEDWREKRRPELIALFQHYMYGFSPPRPERLEATVERVAENLFDGRATLREITLAYGPPEAPRIHLLLVTPNGRASPAPVFAGLNFCGNHAVLDEPHIALPQGWMYAHCAGCVENRATEAGRGADRDVWCVEQVINRGYALATFYNGDIDPDLPDFTDGVHPHYFRPDQSAPGPHDWGTIAAWAWGLQRAVDYLETCAEIDPQRICAIGHSRLGKTALLAGALDERIALVVPHQSGTGGCALSRDNDQETVERINRVFPHWFNDAFTEFNDHEERLPIDQHLLMCLVAPRPLLSTEGDQDVWANYDSGYRALSAADAVYELLGKTGLQGEGLVRGEESIAGEQFGELMQYRRDDPHVLNAAFWTKILDFADAHLGTP